MEPHHSWSLKWGLDIIAQYIFAKICIEAAIAGFDSQKKVPMISLMFRASFPQFYFSLSLLLSKIGFL